MMYARVVGRGGGGRSLSQVRGCGLSHAPPPPPPP
eukprot:SAG25_NODE_7468_length_478_cov_3.530343_1_plen_34_part_01